MLTHLCVENFALFQTLEVELGSGLNVISGETGAGKSLFVDAVAVALGARGISEYIRSGADVAHVSALFHHACCTQIERLGFASGDGSEVLIERQLRRDRKNRARVNGRLSSVNNIKSFANMMVDMHGQHYQQGLLSAAEQLTLLDELAGDEVAALREEVQKIYEDVTAIDNELSELVGDEQEMARRLDLLEYQVEEIGQANLEVGEENELKEQQNILANLQHLRGGVGEVLTSISEGDPGGVPPVVDEVGELASTLQRLAEIDDSLKAVAQSVQGVQYELQEAQRCLRRYLDSLDYDPAQMKQVQERLDLINQLKRKYGDTVEDILRYRDELREQLHELESSEERIDKLQSTKDKLLCELEKKACELSSSRREFAERLEKSMQEELSDLQMQDAQFEVRFTELKSDSGISLNSEELFCSRRGIDSIEFMIAPNPGEPMMKLRSIASGGELARLMLALKNIAAETDQTPTLIFDEIDAGVGGKAGRAVANKLDSIANNHQVLCVTHLPQVAAVADLHFALKKESDSGRTISKLQPVTGQQRVREIARMLGGDVSGSAAIRHAQKLLESGLEQDTSA